ncbi:MAG: DMT family transporter [Paracoccaceae bacterium]
MSSPDRILPGIALMIAFCIFAPGIDVFAKLAALAGQPPGQITLARFAGQAALMLPLVMMQGHALTMPARTFGWTCLRAVLLIASTFSFVMAVRVMPLADALAIVFVEPFILLLLGRAFLGEQVGPRRIVACLIGFAGSLLVIRPSLTIFGPVALYPLGTAVAFAAYMLVTRRLSRDQHPVAMQFHTAFWGAVMMVPALFLGESLGWEAIEFAPVAGRIWLWLAGVGLMATIAHMAITYALKYAPSATLAPLAYLEIVTAAALGYLVFGDFPAPLTWAGVGVIVASGLYVIHRERVVSRRAPPAAPQAPVAGFPAEE